MNGAAGTSSDRCDGQPTPLWLDPSGIVELDREERMATRREANAVYAAGLVQGIVLVTFPAASTIFTDPGEYDLSSTQYGTMLLPQVVTAIVASVLGGSLARRFGTKRVYLAGLVANCRRPCSPGCWR
jgi:MFS family permease